jgi:hypothetical protein
LLTRHAACPYPSKQVFFKTILLLQAKPQDEMTEIFRSLPRRENIFQIIPVVCIDEKTTIFCFIVIFRTCQRRPGDIRGWYV